MKEEQIDKFISMLKFDSNGLIPAIIQDYKTGKVLMLAYMNKEAVYKTLLTKKTHFFSRSRKKLWMKGEQSGNYQLVKSIYLDCDNDCLLIKVRQIGTASCHTGYRSCFYRKLINSGNFKVIEKKIFDPQKVYKE